MTCLSLFLSLPPGSNVKGTLPAGWYELGFLASRFFPRLPPVGLATSFCFRLAPPLFPPFIGFFQIIGYAAGTGVVRPRGHCLGTMTPNPRPPFDPTACRGPPSSVFGLFFLPFVLRSQVLNAHFPNPRESFRADSKDSSSTLCRDLLFFPRTPFLDPSFFPYILQPVSPTFWQETATSVRTVDLRIGVSGCPSGRCAVKALSVSLSSFVRGRDPNWRDFPARFSFEVARLLSPRLFGSEARAPFRGKECKP